MEKNHRKQINEMVKYINAIHGENTLLIEFDKYDERIEIQVGGFEQIMYSAYIDNILLYTTATKNHWFFKVNELNNLVLVIF